MRTSEQEERIKKDFPIYDFCNKDSKGRRRTSVQACCSAGLFTMGRLIGLRSQISGLISRPAVYVMQEQVDRELQALETKWLNLYGVVLRPQIPEGYAKVGKKIRCLGCDSIYGKPHEESCISKP